MSPSDFKDRHDTRTGRAAGIVNFRWHGLRHTFGSRLAMAGCTPFEIKELMGHKTLAMAERYAHLSAGHLDDAIGKLDGAAARIHGVPESPPRVGYGTGQDGTPTPHPTSIFEIT